VILNEVIMASVNVTLL